MGICQDSSGFSIVETKRIIMIMMIQLFIAKNNRIKLVSLVGLFDFQDVLIIEDIHILMLVNDIIEVFPYPMYCQKPRTPAEKVKLYLGTFCNKIGIRQAQCLTLPN